MIIWCTIYLLNGKLKPNRQSWEVIKFSALNMDPLQKLLFNYNQSSVYQLSSLSPKGPRKMSGEIAIILLIWIPTVIYSRPVIRNLTQQLVDLDDWPVRSRGEVRWLTGILGLIQITRRGMIMDKWHHS